MKLSCSKHVWTRRLPFHYQKQEIRREHGDSDVGNIFKVLMEYSKSWKIKKIYIYKDADKRGIYIEFSRFEI